MKGENAISISAQDLQAEYDRAVEHITSLGLLGSKLGLDTINALLERVGSPEKKLKFVHVAGTNGKGSTVSMTAAALTAAGYKTGMYISPSVVDFAERISINMEYADKRAFLNAYREVTSQCEKMTADGLATPTEFETVTAIALKVFADEKCDIAVLEVGLGGRFDATNAIPAPEAAVITSISRDHMAFLGDTLTKIAFEKCGIIKGGCPVVTYPEQSPEALEEIKSQCAKKGSMLIVPDIGWLEIGRLGPDGTQFVYRGEEYFTPLAGEHFAKNAVTAIETLAVLRSKGFITEREHVAAGISSRPFAARLEVIAKSPYIVLDGAHNADAVDKLCAALDRIFPGKRVITVMGMFSDKEYGECIPKIAEKSDIFIATEPENARALPAARTAALAKGRAGHVCAVRQPLHALRTAGLFAGRDDVILCCGSFSFLGQIKNAVCGEKK